MFRKIFLIIGSVLVITNLSFASELLEMKELKEKVKEATKYLKSIDWHISKGRGAYFNNLPKAEIMHLILAAKTSDIKNSSEVERILEFDYEDLHHGFLGIAYTPDGKVGKYNQDYEGDYLFVDLDNDDVYELVYATNNGRAIFSPGIIYWKDEKLKHYSDFDAKVLLLQRLRFTKEWGKGAIQDLNKDGKMEFLFSEVIAGVGGLGTSSFWTAIYNWDGEKLIRVDEKFPEYYQNILIEAAENIKELNDELREHKDLLLPKEKEDIKRRLAGLRLLFEKAQKIVEKK